MHSKTNKQNSYLQSTIHEKTLKSDRVKRTNLNAPMIKPAVFKSIQKQHADTLGILWINPFICSILKIKHVFHLENGVSHSGMYCTREAREIYSNDKQNHFLMKIYSIFLSLFPLLLRFSQSNILDFSVQHIQMLIMRLYRLKRMWKLRWIHKQIPDLSKFCPFSAINWTYLNWWQEQSNRFHCCLYTTLGMNIGTGFSIERRKHCGCMYVCRQIGAVVISFDRKLG